VTVVDVTIGTAVAVAAGKPPLVALASKAEMPPPWPDTAANKTFLKIEILDGTLVEIREAPPTNVVVARELKVRVPPSFESWEPIQ
jgi:hypothetical protein